MLSQEQLTKEVCITVCEAVIISQMLEKLLRTGVVTGRELGPLATMRHRLHASVKVAINVDLDNMEAQANTDE